MVSRAYQSRYCNIALLPGCVVGNPSSLPDFDPRRLHVASAHITLRAIRSSLPIHAYTEHDVFHTVTEPFSLLWRHPNRT
jgi:hypothetical protein